MGSYVELYKSKVAQDARTPRAMMRHMDTLYFRGRQPWDPCPVNHKADGLVVPWRRLNYANCPFAQAAKWLEKADAEAARGNSSLLLLPARLNTGYLHRALPSARALHIWASRICFPPFTQPLSHTIITLCFGPKPWTPPKPLDILDAGAGLSVRRLAADMWDIAPKADRATLKRHARRVFGDGVTVAGASRLPTDGVVLTVLETGFAAGFQAVTAHCRKHPRAAVLLCTLTTFHSTYFPAGADLVRGVVLFRPRLHIAGVEMVASSQLLVMSARPVRFRPQGNMPPTYLVQTRPQTVTDT